MKNDRLTKAVSNLTESQISNQQEENPVSSQENSNNAIQDLEDQEIETTYQRKPQFKFNENNRRKFS